uniref:Uncharacterized protein n=1 Tax=Megaselia scalaris TaxID=36166 RepID=T1GBW4_MEGSC
MITNKSTQIPGNVDDIHVDGRTTSSVASVDWKKKLGERMVNADKIKSLLSSRIQKHHESLGPIEVVKNFMLFRF